MKLKIFPFATELCRSLFASAPIAAMLTLALMLFRSLTSGVGLLLIIPLLHAIGIPLLGQGNPSLSQKFADFFLSIHIPLNLSNILLAYILIMTFIATIEAVEELISARWQERHLFQLRKTIYQTLLNTQWIFFIKRTNSDILHGITDQLSTSWLCHFQLLQLINQLILIAVYIALSCLVSVQMTLLASCIALTLLCLMLPLQRLAPKMSQHFLQHSRLLFKALYEQLNALKIIKSGHFEEKFIANILSESSSLRRQTQRFALFSAASKWLYATGSVVAFSFLLYISLEKMHMPLDSLLLLLLCFARLMPKVSALQQSALLFIRYTPSYTSLLQLLADCRANQEINVAQDAGPADGNVEIAFHQQISFNNVSFAYDASLPMIIQNFSLCLQKNTTTALIGASGIGKTTAADLLVGLLNPTLGHIQIDQKKLDQNSCHAWRKKIAYITQDVFLFNTTIRDNLMVFSEPLTEKDLWDALDQAAAGSFVRRLDKGIDTIIGDRGVRLSGGERQRLALARALLMKPQLLILDESTNSLDSDHIQQIQQSLLKLHGRMTIFIISHQAEMSQFADQVITLQANATNNQEETTRWTSVMQTAIQPNA